ncbi:MAG: hypothetical protein H0A76_13520 [Candidatus Thiodubiliella endoseptemdiera]|uniref:Uncharacterized protein n=1 Tax=Candidatus Thiodubiliella endoseptemdiera TaxID=2738886 RepID=A0A853F436_9GAMM|nr:hypothetical protein [Candidatus Thiodubiliella endoseptemdiera]NYT28764.1 hypothetical protein [Candidatus Thiodubiliella endoseptemdiera]
MPRYPITDVAQNSIYIMKKEFLSVVHGTQGSESQINRYKRKATPN